MRSDSENQLAKACGPVHSCGMEFFKTPRLSASITPDGLAIRHANGACVTIPLKRLESWLLRMLRAEV
jgi:hypothetical protein